LIILSLLMLDGVFAYMGTPDQHSVGRFTELTGKGIDVRFLEKVNGEWKIVYLSSVDITSYEDEEEDEESETEE
ncbi:unnamed protein product, partial [marine sediment metagenome]